MFFHLLEFSSQTLTGPLKKLKKFQIALCLLKLVLTFQLDIQDICQIQHNFKALQKANKFIENYEVETFSKFSVFQKDAGFQNTGCVILDVRVFGTCYLPKSWNPERKRNI